jgi:MFS family permease
LQQELSSSEDRGNGLKITLLLTGSLTVMAGAIITAAIPDITRHYAAMPYAELISKLMLTLPSLLIALLAPVAGQIIDRFGRIRPLLIALALYSVGGVSGFFIDNLYLILAGRAVLGIAVAGIMTINTTLIGDYFQGRMRSVFLGWQGAIMGFGGVVYIAAGGLLADISWRWPFLIYLFSLVLMLLAMKYLTEPVHQTRTKADRQPAATVRRVQKYRLLYISAFAGMLFFFIIPTQVPFLLQQVKQLSNSQVGFSIGFAVLSGAIVSYFYGRIRRRFNFHQIYMITFGLMGGGYMMVGLVDSYAGILTGLLIAGLGNGLLMPNTNLWLISIAPVLHRGRQVGRLNFAVYAGQFLSPLAVQPIVFLADIDMVFCISGILMAGLALYFFSLNRKFLQTHS